MQSDMMGYVIDPTGNVIPVDAFYPFEDRQDEYLAMLEDLGDAWAAGSSAMFASTMANVWATMADEDA